MSERRKQKRKIRRNCRNFLKYNKNVNYEELSSLGNNRLITTMIRIKRILKELNIDLVLDNDRRGLNDEMISYRGRRR